MKFQEIAHKTRLLLAEHHEPKEVAFGVAVGIFIGCTPLYGFHTILAILASLVMHKANRLAILAGTQISLPFLAPLIYWAEYKMGKTLLLLGLLIAQSDRELNHIELGLFAMLVGSAILGLIFACLGYFATLYAADKIKERKTLERAKAHGL